ncbi:GNAT family protein [Candidatus Hakubella thermalkaliphila]|uniref:hypothetical protein n=1 Tax=Candidatus Hakubella thermalkaliphila TaxID=2754717 RepID=UPI00159489B5|nr:hypothetical protein [Candidatus Hakubella thermalkaliphila]
MGFGKGRTFQRWPIGQGEVGTGARFCKVKCTRIEKPGSLGTPLDEVTILPMQDGDLDQVTQIEKEIFPTPWTRRQFQFEIRNHCCHYFVAKIGDVVIGYTGLVVVGSEGYITRASSRLST